MRHVIAALLVLSAEDREVNVALRVLLEVDHERIGVRDGRVESMIQARVVEQHAYCAVLAVHLVCYLVHVAQRLVYLLLSRSEVECSEVACECCSVVEHSVSLCHECRHALVESAHECV